MYMETPEDIEEFKIWIRTLPDPNGVLMRFFDSFVLHLTLKIDTDWWEHKEMHVWLLPGVIQCLSDIDPDIWHVMEATTNFGEAQHAANNAETGIGMGLVQSFIQCNSIVFSLYFTHYSPPDTRLSIPGVRPRSKSCFKAEIYTILATRCLIATQVAMHAV